MSDANVDGDQTLQSAPREELIQTAVKFLQNPNVVSSPLAQKQKFLQRKGLTDREIQLACERSGSYVQHEMQPRVPPTQLPPPIPYGGYGTMQVTVFDRLRSAIYNVTLFSAFAYGLYKFYEKFIRPFFGKRKKTVEESVDELNKNMTKSVNELKDKLASVKVEVDRINHDSETNTQRQLQSLQAEISTVKGLLLSRKQFPSVSNSPVVPPSIPAWQLSSVPTEPESEPKTEDERELEDVASGSGSSDPEHATKNSDSSLEIIS